jgi:hypothetical protein
MRVFVNNWSTKLLQGISSASGNAVMDTLYVSTAAAQALKDAITRAQQIRADAQTYLTLDDGVNVEIVRVNDLDAVSGWIDVYRAQEGTAAPAWTATSTTVSLRVTAVYLDNLHNDIVSRIATNGTDVLIGANGEVLTH